MSIVGIINAQTDSLIMINGDVMVGEMKGMSRGVVTIETDYSKDDFRVEWKGVREIRSVTSFIITTKDGTRLTGSLISASPGKVSIKGTDGSGYEFDILDLVDLKKLDRGFWDRLKVNLDIGYSLTKSNNLMQLTMNSKVGYLAEHWSADINYNTLFSKQDDVDDIRRIEGGGTFNYFLPRDWFLPAAVSFLSNTEQKLDLRTLATLGAGNYVIHTNHSYWGFAAGVAYNNERYSDSESKLSWEGYLGSELNLYDIGDLNLMTKVVAYPSFTESGRWRLDYILDTKYDLPLDFYIKIGVTVNFDNQPVEGAAETAYVLQTGFGWEWE